MRQHIVKLKVPSALRYEARNAAYLAKCSLGEFLATAIRDLAWKQAKERCRRPAGEQDPHQPAEGGT